MADNNDMMNDLSIDKILEDVRELTGNSEKPQKLWSLEDIDALLNDSGNEAAEEVTQESVDEYLNEIMSEPVARDDFNKKQSEPQAVEEKITEEPTIIPVEDGAEEDDGGFVLAEINYDDTDEDYDNEIKEVIREHIPEKAETSVISDKQEASGGFGLKEFAKKIGVIEKIAERHNEKVQHEQENVDEVNEDVIDNSEETVQEVAAPETEESIDDDFETEFAAAFDDIEEPETNEEDAEIEPLIDSTVVSDAEEPAEEDNSEELEKTRIIDVPGQISIEKTRLFNEVEARAVRDESITHHIGASKVIRTGEIPKGTMETDPYRERFLNKPELNIEKTQEHKDLFSKLPPKTIEKHGVVIKKSELDKTSEDGLTPIPTLVDAADEYDAQKKLELETQSGALKHNSLDGEDDEQLDNQIMLDGFTDDDEVEVVNEDEAERELLKVRKDKASKFRLFPNLEVSTEDVYSHDEDDESEADDESEDEDEEQYDGDELTQTQEDEQEQEEAEEPVKKRRLPREPVRVAREFFGPKDAKPVYELYLKRQTQLKMKVIVSAIAIALLLLSSIITTFFGNFTLFADSPAVYSAINFIILVAVGAVNYKAFYEAVMLAKKKSVNSSTAIAAVIIVGAVQSLVSLGFGDLVVSGTHIYASVAVFPVLLISIGNYIKCKTDIANFVLLNKKQGEFYAVKDIEDENEAFEIGRGLMIKDPDIRYGTKVNFPYKFVEMSRTVDPTVDLFRLVLPVAALAALIVGVISGILNKNIFVGLTAFTGVFMMSVPAASVVSSASILRSVNKQLNEEGGMVSGYEAVENALEANAVAINASDLFDDGAACIYGIKQFNSMRIDEAILYTAAVVIQSKGALTDVFDSVILSKREILPQVESLAYEERLGCSGWIYNYRVLVGNRDLLLKHNVEVQPKEEESKYLRAGAKIVYLAVEGKVAAMFVVGYKADTSTADYLQSLERYGINILVSTTDANISEDFVEQEFDLPRNFIKVISPVAGIMLKELGEQEAVNAPCRVLHNGTINSMLNSYTSAFTINERKKISTILQYVGVGIGILLMAMFSFLSGLSQAGAVQVLLFEALWSSLVVFIPRLKKI